MHDRWGFVCSVYDGSMDYHVPDDFLVAAANIEAADYLRRIAAELARRPYRYGYDPKSTYTIIVQTWDRALMSARSLGLGRPIVGHHAVGLIPDAYYIRSSGYMGLHHLALGLPPWSERTAKFVWRGSVTGQSLLGTADSIPRVKLALAGRELPDTDIAIMGIHETMQFDHEELRSFLTREMLLGQWLPMGDFGHFKYVIDIDGHANAWGLLEKLILGCCVLKVESPYEQWYYSRLHAWEHYVPIAADLSNLSEQVQWCLDHDDHCRWIAANGARLADTLRFHAELPRSCFEFMKAATATVDIGQDAALAALGRTGT